MNADTAVICALEHHIEMMEIRHRQAVEQQWRGVNLGIQQIAFKNLTSQVEQQQQRYGRNFIGNLFGGLLG